MKKIKMFATIVAFAVTLMAASALSAQEWTKEQKEVWNEVEKMWTNWKAGDLDAAFANVDDRYLGWNNETPMPMSKAKWVVPMKENIEKFTNRGFDVEPARILVIDDAAVVHYYYSMWWVYNDEEKKKEGHSNGKWTEFFIKENGKWILIGDFTYSEPE